MEAGCAHYLVNNMEKLICALLLVPCLAFAGERLPVDSWKGDDKKMHFGVSFVLGFAAGAQWPENKPLAFGVAMIPGLIKEATDTKASGKDLVANAVGAALGVYTGGWLITRNQGTTKVAYAAWF